MAVTGMTFLTAQVAFYYLASASLASAILAVTRKNPVHSMLWVLALFLHVAGIFLLLGAEFLAAVQVIVYAGAILVFYLFVMMILDLSGEEARPRFGGHWPFAAAVGFSFAALAWLAQADSFAPEKLGTDGPYMVNLSEVGINLFGPFALPFEIVSLVLLAAIVGAILLARKKATA